MKSLFRMTSYFIVSTQACMMKIILKLTWLMKVGILLLISSHAISVKTILSGQSNMSVRISMFKLNLLNQKLHYCLKI